MRMSKQFFPRRLILPEDFRDIPTEDLFERIGFMNFIDSGIPYFLPIGKKIVNNLENYITKKFEKRDFEEISLPRIHSKELIEKSGKFQEYESEFFTFENYVLRATSEEFLFEIANRGLQSHMQLPIEYIVRTRANRMIKRPKGILKLREFGGIVAGSLNENHKSYEDSLEKFSETVEEILSKLQIPFTTKDKSGGIEFFYEDSSETTLSLAMGYQTKPNEKFHVRFQDSNNQYKTPIMGTFGIGLERILYSLFDSHRSNSSLNLGNEIKPYEGAIIPIDPKNLEHMKYCNDIYREKEDYYLDDRSNLSLKQRLDFADLISVDDKIIIGDKEVKGKLF